MTEVRLSGPGGMAGHRSLPQRPEAPTLSEAAPQARTLEPCLPPAPCKPRLRRSEASEYLELAHGLSVAPATLAKLASIGGGPAFHRAGRTPLYPRDELDRWAVERLGRLLRNTSEVGGR